MQQQIFRRNLNMRYVMNRAIHGNPMSVRASFPRMRDGGYDVILSTLHVPERGLLKDFPIIKVFRLLAPRTWKKLVAAPPFRATLSIMDDFEKAVDNTRGYEWSEVAGSVQALDTFLERPKGNRPIIAIHAVEGAHSLGLETTSTEGALKNLEVFFERGVACLTLAHFYRNLVVNPTYPFPDDVVKLSVRPNMWRDLTKGLTDWEIKRIARDGGVIGVIFMPYWLMPKESAQGLNFVSRHMQYLVDVGGADCVGIGTDFDGFATPPEDLDNASRMPRLTLLTLFGHRLSYADFLPPTHAVIALNKIFTLGAGFQDVVFEIALLILLTVVYFSTGVWLFQRTQMKR